MKPSIPEVGIVTRLKEDVATIMLKGGESCKGCGQAKIGLCKAAGTNMIISVKNPIGARVGDIVTIGIDKRTKSKGYFLAFIFPLLSLIIGAFVGHIISIYFLIPSFDVIAGFISLLLTSFFSYRKLKILDLSSSMVITSIISENNFSEYIEPEEIKKYSEKRF